MRTFEEVIKENPKAIFFDEHSSDYDGACYDKDGIIETFKHYIRDGCDMPDVFLALMTHKGIGEYDDKFIATKEQICIKDLWLSLGGKI